MNIGYNTPCWGYTQKAIERYYGWNEPEDLNFLLNEDEISEQQFEEKWRCEKYQYIASILSEFEQENWENIFFEEEVKMWAKDDWNVVEEQELMLRYRKWEMYE